MSNARCAWRHCVALGPLGFLGDAGLGDRGLEDAAHLRSGGACSLGLGGEIGEAVLVGEALGGRLRRLGGGDVTVPAPEVARAGDETLTGTKERLEPRPGLAVGHDAGLGKAAGEHRRRLDAGRHRLGAVGQRRVVGEGIDAMPVGRCGGVDRRVELVAAGGAEGGLIARRRP